MPKRHRSDAEKVEILTLLEAGTLTTKEIGQKFDVNPRTIRRWKSTLLPLTAGSNALLTEVTGNEMPASKFSCRADEYVPKKSFDWGISDPNPKCPPTESPKKESNALLAEVDRTQNNKLLMSSHTLMVHEQGLVLGQLNMRPNRITSNHGYVAQDLLF